MDEKINKICNEYDKGYSQVELSKKYNIDKRVLRKELILRGIKIRKYKDLNESPIYKRRMKERAEDRWESSEYKEKMIKAHTNKIIPLKQRDKISVALKKASKEGRLTRWNKGLTKETDDRLKKMSDKFKGRKLSEETRKKMSLTFKGKKRSEETKQRLSLSKLGKNNPMYGKEMPLKTKIKKSAKVQGIKEEDWKGFVSFEPYDMNFNQRFKRLIRKRDNYICMACGKHQEKEKRSLDVHHVNYNKQLTIPQNCIALCRYCHGVTNNNRKHWTKFFHSILSEKYNYKYEEGEPMIQLELNKQRRKNG